MKIVIVGISSTTNSTVSMLFIDGKHRAFLIEDGYRDPSIAGKTQIPAGVYPILPRYHGDFYSQYRREFGHEFLIEIVNVPGFQDSFFCVGNTPYDTGGKLLVNSGFKFNGHGDYFGVDSRPAYQSFYDLVSPELKGGRPVVLVVNRNSIITENFES